VKDASSSSSVQILLNIPGMIERPAVGTSCCVTSAEALIAQELWMLPGVEDAQIDARVGTALVTFDPATVSEDEIAAALGDVGYPPARQPAAR
jgi:copper chaperone CopZ